MKLLLMVVLLFCTALLSALPGSAIAAWHTETKVDELLDDKVAYARSSRWGPTMTVLCKKGEWKAYIHFGAVLDSENLMFRFDDGPVYEDRASRSTNYQALFFMPAWPVVIKAMQSNSLKARARAYLGGDITRTVNLSGSADAIRQAATFAGCDLSGRNDRIKSRLEIHCRSDMDDPKDICSIQQVRDILAGGPIRGDAAQSAERRWRPQSGPP